MEASFKDVSEEDSIKSSELIEGSRKSCEVMNLSDVKIELVHRQSHLNRNNDDEVDEADQFEFSDGKQKVKKISSIE